MRTTERTHNSLGEQLYNAYISVPINVHNGVKWREAPISDNGFTLRTLDPDGLFWDFVEEWLEKPPVDLVWITSANYTGYWRIEVRKVGDKRVLWYYDNDDTVPVVPWD